MDHQDAIGSLTYLPRVCMVSHNGELPRRKLTGVDLGSDGGVLKCYVYVGHSWGLTSFPGSSAWAEKKEPGTHCLRMLSSLRITGNLEISVKSAPLHLPPQDILTSPV